MAISAGIRRGVMVICIDLSPVLYVCGNASLVLPTTIKSQTSVLNFVSNAVYSNERWK
jgi:hypothetical protein